MLFDPVRVGEPASLNRPTSICRGGLLAQSVYPPRSRRTCSASQIVRTSRTDRHHGHVYISCTFVYKNGRRVPWNRMHCTVCTCDALMTNRCVLVGPLFHVVRTSCPTVVPEIRGIEGVFIGRQGFGFDLPLPLLPSSPSQSRNCSHSGVLVHFRHSVNRTS